MDEQRTIKSPVDFDGVGLHSGRRGHLTLRPAPANAGVTIIRKDLTPEVRIPVRLENRRSNARRSTLGVGDTEVHTVEHLLAVLHVLDIQNLVVEIDGPEVPGMDGSAADFLEGVLAAGLQEQGLRARTMEIREPIAVQADGASLVALPAAGKTRVSYTLQYDAPACITQHLSIDIDAESFRRGIAPARTFVLESEVKELKARGLGLGATTHNTLVVGAQGVVDNQLRFPDECVRHKILDLLGDLFILGSHFHGHLIAHRSGHFLNLELAQKLADHFSREREVEQILTGADRGLDLRQLQKILPHRYPFLLVDRVLQIEGDTRAVGLKNVSYNEEYFQGHFPGQPVMPGVLQLEAMAQLAGVLLLRKCSKIRKLAYILSMDNVKFRRTVVPGDQLILEAEAKKVRSKTGQVDTRALVDGNIVAEATIHFMFVDETPG